MAIGEIRYKWWFNGEIFYKLNDLNGYKLYIYIYTMGTFPELPVCEVTGG